MIQATIDLAAAASSSSLSMTSNEETFLEKDSIMSNSKPNLVSTRKKNE